jgi:hypothetical protein
MPQIVSFLEWMGWRINNEKSSLVPSSDFVWLGWRWSAPMMTVRLPEDERLSLLYYLRAMTAALNSNSVLPIRKLASAIGKLNACRFQYPQASLFLARLNRLKTEAVALSGWNGKVCLSGEGLREEVLWWENTIRTNAPTSLALRPPEATLTTDAAKEGWGAHVTILRTGQQLLMHGVWDHRKRTSNNREMTAVLRALRRMQQLPETKSVSSLSILSDNTTTVFDINKQKACDSLRPTLTLLLRFAEIHRLDLIAKHIPGDENGLADSLSRISAAGDYALRPEVLRQLLTEWRVEIDVDLFAAGWNAKSPHYCSLKRDRRALARDAWTIPWSRFRLPLIHPPISQIPKVLARLHQEKMQAIVVLPDWPFQVWTNQAKAMTVATKILGKAAEVLIPGKQDPECPSSLPIGNIRVNMMDTRTTSAKST